MGEPYDPGGEGAKMGFADTMSYGDYLRLDLVLGAQRTLSDAPDELLFIIQHQNSELWMKLALLELAAARDAIASGDLRPAFKNLARVSRIMEQLNSAWDVLRTMTPSDYTTFRDALGQSSGFQSLQYRLIEFTLGNRNRHMIKPHDHESASAARLMEELDRPSLYHVVLDRLREAGFALPDDFGPRDAPHPHRPEIEAAWAEIYRDTGNHWPLYELAEKLVDLEDYFRRWRFNHVTTVERVIGSKRGTGGTGGVTYLRRMLEVVLFPELWAVRTAL